MPPHTPSRQVEQSLRVKLFTRSYDTLQFRAEKRAFLDPKSDKFKVTSVFLHLTLVLENDATATAPLPVCFRIVRTNSDPFTPPGTKLYVAGTSIHKLHQLQVPFHDSYSGMSWTRDVAYGKATWRIDHFPSDDDRLGMKVTHREGQIDIYQEADIGQVAPRSRYIGDFIKPLSKNGDELETHDPFFPLNYMLSLPKLDEPGSVMFMMEICGKNTHALVMDVKAPDDSYALKFTLNLPVEDTDGQGTLEVRSRGLNYPTTQFPYLRGMLFALWLVHSGEESTYFETRKTR